MRVYMHVNVEVFDACVRMHLLSAIVHHGVALPLYALESTPALLPACMYACVWDHGTAAVAFVSMCDAYTLGYLSHPALPAVILRSRQTQDTDPGVRACRTSHRGAFNMLPTSTRVWNPDSAYFTESERAVASTLCRGALPDLV